MNRNQTLHELLGKCRHEYNEETGYCRHCFVNVHAADNRPTINPDYAADPRLVLEAMREREDWQAFGNYTLLISTIGLNGAFTFAVPVDYILDKTGKMRALAIEFLRRGK